MPSAVAASRISLDERVADLLIDGEGPLGAFTLQAVEQIDRLGCVVGNPHLGEHLQGLLVDELLLVVAQIADPGLRHCFLRPSAVVSAPTASSGDRIFPIAPPPR